MNGPEIINMGCRLNIAESAALHKSISEYAAAAGGDSNAMVIINSCAVTNTAMQQTRQAIRRARRTHPDKRLIVTGCAAQIDPAMFAAMPETDLVIGNYDKYDPAVFFAHASAANSPAKVLVSDIMAVRETAPHMVAAFADRARAFVEIQNGCDHRCTFCIIPFGRGNSRSVPAGQVIDQIKALVDQGHSEVVLTGVDVTSYGPDLPGAPTFGQLVERIVRHVPDLPRLRLSSLDGIEIDDRLFDLMTGEARIMPHVHLSLQAGDDMILKRMKRRHSRAQAVDLVARLKSKRPEIAIGADIIAGFPTETEDMFLRSLNLVRDCDIVHGHIFPYSARSGTPAARMPQVDPESISARAQRLRSAVVQQKSAWLDGLIGTRQSVLVEKSGRSGFAANFARVALRDPVPAGRIIAAQIVARSGEDALSGEEIL
jgi:threonylcarbamoyladenosine tRNA methylthiotransferase MtaB